MLPGAEKRGDISTLLEKIYSDSGWDFRNYKKTSLSRRISKRLQARSVSSYSEYSDILEADPSEFQKLFSNITIKVSEVFRTLYDAISSGFEPDKPLKAWCCACACGEEPYSLAMLLERYLSPEALAQTKLFATDIDPDALDTARRGVYREESLKNVPLAVRQKYFERVEGGYKVMDSIRGFVRFGMLDIVRSPSISRLDILLCRNLFIYFNKPLQEAVFEKLDYSLRPGSLLVLGKAEVVPASYAHIYEQVGKRTSIYRKTGKR